MILISKEDLNNRKFNGYPILIKESYFMYYSVKEIFFDVRSFIGLNDFVELDLDEECKITLVYDNFIESTCFLNTFNFGLIVPRQGHLLDFRTYFEFLEKLALINYKLKNLYLPFLYDKDFHSILNNNNIDLHLKSFRVTNLDSLYKNLTNKSIESVFYNLDFDILLDDNMGEKIKDFLYLLYDFIFRHEKFKHHLSLELDESLIDRYDLYIILSMLKSKVKTFEFN